MGCGPCVRSHAVCLSVCVRVGSSEPVLKRGHGAVWHVPGEGVGGLGRHTMAVPSPGCACGSWLLALQSRDRAFLSLVCGLLRALLGADSTLCLPEAPGLAVLRATAGGSRGLWEGSCSLQSLTSYCPAAAWARPWPRVGLVTAGKFRWLCSGRPSLRNNGAQKTGAWQRVSEDGLRPASRRGKGRVVLGERLRAG